jgi:hypothetical protein
LIASPVAVPSEPSQTVTPAAEAQPTTQPTLDPNDVGGAELPAVPSVSPRSKTTTTGKSATQSQARPAARQGTTTQSRPAAKPVAKPKPAAKPASKPKPAAKPVAKPKPASKPATPEISGDTARELVLSSTGGGLTRSVSRVEHNGYTAWAVQVTRHDTSTVTGWVEVHSGTIFDWHVDSPANPSPSAQSGDSSHQQAGGGGGSHSGGHGSDD